MPGHSKIYLTVVTKVQGKCRCSRNERDQHFLFVHRNSKWLVLIFYCSPAFTKIVEVKIRSAQPPWMQTRLETDFPVVDTWMQTHCRQTLRGRPPEADLPGCRPPRCRPPGCRPPGHVTCDACSEATPPWTDKNL